MQKDITVLGSTGVIGQHTLEVVRSQRESYRVRALCAGSNTAVLAEQIQEFHPEYVSVKTESDREVLSERLRALDSIPEIGVGDSGLVAAAQLGADIVVTAIVGIKGLAPTYTAIQAKSTIALANKETLVSAGELVMSYAKEQNVPIVPVDSEHCAIHQSLRAGHPDEVETYLLTASGGPFRTWTKEAMEQASVSDALKHPNWSMGKKITIDSATMMNKGLEVIEAHHLFNVSYDRIKVVVHPQSVIHSMVEFVDGSVVAQLATPDMRLPIQYALTYPQRLPGRWPKLNLFEISNLTFEEPDYKRFPSLPLAYEAGKAGGYAPCVLNAANEIVVEGFLQGRVGFLEMAKVIDQVLQEHQPGNPRTIEDILEMDRWAREVAETILRKRG